MRGRGLKAGVCVAAFVVAGHVVNAGRYDQAFLGRTVGDGPCAPEACTVFLPVEPNTPCRLDDKPVRNGVTSLFIDAHGKDRRTSGECRDGNAEGVWRSWFPQYALDHYEHGRRQGEHTTFSDGNFEHIIERNFYNKGTLEGRGEWFDNGRLVNVCNYSHGQPEGMCEQYPVEGLTIRANYEAGKSVGARIYDGPPSLVLPYALQNGDMDVVNRLLDSHPPTSSLFPKDSPRPVLLYAEQRWNGKELLARLLDAGAPVNAQNDDGDTALLRADPDVVPILLAHGANPNLANKVGMTPLMLQRQSELVVLLLEHGALPDMVNADGDTALMIRTRDAQESGDSYLDVVALLLNAGANPDKTAPGKRSPRKIAESSDNGNLARLFSVAGAAAARTADHKQRMWERRCPPNELDNIVRFKTEGEALAWLARCNDLPVKSDWVGTAFSEAAVTGKLALIERMIELGVDVNSGDLHRFTGLHNAAMNGQVGALDVLLRHGANPDAVTVLSWTPLMVAVDKCRIDIIKRLLTTNLDVNRHTPDGQSALIVAKTDCPAAVRLLEEHGAREPKCDHRAELDDALTRMDVPAVKRAMTAGVDVNCADSEGMTSLMQHAALGHARALPLLLERGANVNAVDLKGWTALHYAVAVDSEATPTERVLTVRTLLDRGARVDASSTDESLLLQAAKCCRQVGAPQKGPRRPRADVAFIQECLSDDPPAGCMTSGLDDTRPKLSGKKRGPPQLCRASMSGFDEGTQTYWWTERHGGECGLGPLNDDPPVFPEAGFAMCKLLIEHGAKVPDGALISAVHNENAPLVRLLLQHGADGTAVSVMANQSVAVIAASSPSTAVAMAFIEKGVVGKGAFASVGESMLHAAVEEGTTATVEALLRAGVSPDDGQPIFAAVERNRVDIVRALLKAGASPHVHREGDGLTPKLVALTSGHGALAKEFRLAGATEFEQRRPPTLPGATDAGNEVTSYLYEELTSLHVGLRFWRASMGEHAQGLYVVHPNGTAQRLDPKSDMRGLVQIESARQAIGYARFLERRREGHSAGPYEITPDDAAHVEEEFRKRDAPVDETYLDMYRTPPLRADVTKEGYELERTICTPPENDRHQAWIAYRVVERVSRDGEYAFVRRTQTKECEGRYLID